jgi:phenylacetate-CoA ligase
VLKAANSGARDRLRNQIEDVIREIESAEFEVNAALLARRAAKLRAVIEFHEAHSPMFRRRVARCLGSGRSLRVHGDLSQLAPIRKADLQDAGDDLFSSPPSDHGAVHFVQTSGSTGRPTRVRRTRHADVHWMAFALREAAWHSRDFSRSSCSIRSHGDTPISRDDWGTPFSLFGTNGPFLLLPLSFDIARLAEEIVNFQPAYLQTFPSILLALARYFDEHALCLESLRGLKVFGEVFTEAARTEIGAIFKVPVANTYSSEEVGFVGSECASGALHVNTHSLFVEVLDQDGHACKSGGVGRVVVTDLTNFATPLIRYDLDDYAEVGGACPCGRRTPTLRRVMGRRRNLMMLPNGRLVWPELGYLFRLVQAEWPVRQFRLVQSAPDHIEVNVCLNGASGERAEIVFADALARVTGFRYRLTFKYVAAFDASSPDRKVEDFKNLLL